MPIVCSAVAHAHAKKTPVQNYNVVELKRIQNSLVSESNGNRASAGTREQKKKKTTIPRFNLKGNRIVD